MASSRLLPILARLNGIDYSTVNNINVAANLQEQMLIQKNLDGILGFNYSIYIASYFALEKAEEDCAVWAVRGPWALQQSAKMLRAAGKPNVERMERPPIEGDEAFINNTDYMTFGTAKEPAAEEDWRDVTPLPWADAVAALETAESRLADAVARLSVDDLDRIVAGRDYTTYVMLHGVIQHNLYHAGQIAILKKQLRA